MKKRTSGAEKSLIVGKISDFLRNHPDVVFAYAHGSFVRGDGFSDIDIGVYVLDGSPEDTIEREMRLEEKITSLLGVPADVRVLNGAPVSFVYRVIKDSLLVADKAPDLRAGFEGRIFKNYFDFAFFRKRYLREVGDAQV